MYMKRFSALLLAASVLFTISVPSMAEVEPMRLKTVVIDPGHGGKDAGCVSRDKKTYEKNITLDIGLRLRDKIQAAYPDVKVIMTRSDDHFVELENRAVTANKAGADLFISIHVNSVEKGTTANGYSIHCLGQSHRKGTDLYSKNLDLVKRENSVILLEDNYEAKYQGFNPDDPQSSIIFSLMHNSHLENSLAFAVDVAASMGSSPIKNSRGVTQDPFWVLWRTAMPSVLIEVGFITNPADLETMRKADGRDAIAANIFKAFSTFKQRYDASLVQEGTQVQEAAAPAKAEVTEPKAVYGTQVLVSAKKMSPKDPFFLGYRVYAVNTGKVYKYIIGAAETREQASLEHQKIKGIIPDSFVVKIPEDAEAL